MGQPKPFASLSSGLLARKGQAKPAMRPQGFSGFGAVSEAIDDLGWNDMGLNETQPGPAPVTAAVPPVLRQREQLREEVEIAPAATVTPIMPIAADSVVVSDIVAEDTAPVEVPAQPKQRKAPALAADHAMDAVPRSADKGRGKAAFTLRLDADRHLRLRLASALRHRSSQQLVTEALDNFLKTLPEVEAMAVQLSSGTDGDLGNGG